MRGRILMRRYWFPKPYSDVVARLRVPSGFLLLAAFAWLSKPTLKFLLAGVPLSVIGLLLRAWAAGHLAKNQNLATGGPYSYMRNPLYAGTVLVASGLAIGARSGPLAIIFAAVIIFVYLPVIELEEQHLRDLFPDYEQYSARVPLLFPYRMPMRSETQFQSALYKKNEEYKALIGYLIALALLLWKSGSL
jgi:protein-S-isoprenylcysteine O-methyltransferase Ste14